MIYKRIHLKDFKRMYLSGIREFIMEFPDPITLILGTNGSGKSSLVNEISPLPADKDAFGVDGFKEVEFEHNGITYIIKTTFKKGTKCSFIRVESNGEHTELNPGGTQAVLKTKVEEMFGYTDFIHQLLNNKHSFSAMPTSKRREWFTNMSNVDYDYALSLYNLIKDKHRDKVGLVKECKKDVADSVFSLETVSDLEEEKAKSEKVIAELRDTYLNVQALIHNKPFNTTSETELKDTINKIRQMTLRYTSIRNHIFVLLSNNDITYTVDVKAKVEKILQSNQQHLSKLDGVIQTLENELNKLNNKHTQLLLDQKQIEENKRFKVNIRNLEAYLSEKKKEIDHFKEQFKLTYDCDLCVDDYKAFNSAFHANFDEIERIIKMFQEDGRIVKTYTKERLHDLRNKIEDNKLLLKSLMVEKEHKDRLREKHLAALANESNYVTCPKCKEHFYHGEEHVHDEDLELINKINNVEQELNELEDAASNLTYTQGLLMEFYKLNLQNTPLYGLHNVIHQKRYLLSSPAEIRTVIEEHFMVAQLLEEAEFLENEIKEAKARDELEKSFQLRDLHTLEKEIDTLKNKLSSEYNTRNSLRVNLEDVRTLKNNLEELDATAQQLETLVEANKREIDELYHYELKNALQPHLEELRKALQAEQDTVKECERKIAIAKATLEKLKQAEEDVKAYELLLKEMSPNTGMIANGLLGFIRVFLADMNAIIARVWSYPLIVKVAEDVDEKGLTYRFPIITGTDGDEIPDVAMGSSGIQEIVNLAFKIVSMKYMGISEFPLFLDEFGKTFDSSHRIQAGKVINTLISEHKHQQLFMVSHYSDSYGSMVNCNICVLDDTNIVLPLGQYNNNVKLFYKEVKND